MAIRAGKITNGPVPQVRTHEDCWGQATTCQGTRAGGLLNGYPSIYDWYTHTAKSANGKRRLHLIATYGTARSREGLSNDRSQVSRKHAKRWSHVLSQVRRRNARAAWEIAHL